MLAPLGRFNDAHAEIELAKELDPLSLLVNNAAGWIYYSEGQYDKAIDVATETLEMQSALSSAHTLLGATYTQKGMYDEAIAAWDSWDEWAHAASVRARNSFPDEIEELAPMLAQHFDQAQDKLKNQSSRLDQLFADAKEKAKDMEDEPDDPDNPFKGGKIWD